MFTGNSFEEEKVNQTIEQRLQEITFRQFNGKILTPAQTALNMFRLFEDIISSTTWKDANELKSNYKRVCERLLERDRLNFVVRNCSERMLKMLKQKCYDLRIEIKESLGISTIQSLRHLTLKNKTSSVKDDDAIEAKVDPFANLDAQDLIMPEDMKAGAALSRRTTMMPSTVRSNSNSRISIVDRKKTQLTRELKLAIREVIEEIELSKEEVTAQAKEHISDNDLILTYHTSQTLNNFFIEAKEYANFEVIVAETAPTFTGHETAQVLA